MEKLIKLTRSIFLFCIFVVSTFVQGQIIDVNFTKIQGVDTDQAKTLKSIVKARDISEQYATGGLYLMTHYGTLDELFQKENQKLINHPWIEQTWRFCSIFSTPTEDGVVIGRNWDNQNVVL